MRFGAVPGNPVEWVVARLELAPQPLLETQMAYTLARVVMEGVRAGVFEALRDGARTADDVARACDTDPGATEKLLFTLAGCGYLRASDREYRLTRRSRRWLLAGGRRSLRDKLLFQFDEWDLMARSGEYLRTGRPLEIHDGGMTPEQWERYQRGMRSLAGALSGEAVRRLPVPRGARAMLDIGGSHGFYSVALCRCRPGLRATILDLPAAVEHAAPLLAAEGMGDRVVHRAGNALTEDLGEQAYDLVLVAQLVHHFSDAENRELARRIARALRPGGVYAILDAFRPASASDAGQVGALLDFYFALTSRSGTWSPETMAEWQRAAGLVPRKAIRFVSAPGAGLQVAVRA